MLGLGLLGSRKGSMSESLSFSPDQYQHRSKMLFVHNQTISVFMTLAPFPQCASKGLCPTCPLSSLSSREKPCSRAAGTIGPNDIFLGSSCVMLSELDLRENLATIFFQLYSSKSGRQEIKQAEIRYIPISIWLQMVRFTAAQVPSENASFWKNVMKRMIDVIRPLRMLLVSRYRKLKTGVLITGFQLRM